jgi:hypothetical protein
MAFELATTLDSGVSGNYWYLGHVEVVCNDSPFVVVSMDLYLDRQSKLDGKAIMQRRSTNMSLYDIDASVSYDFRACIYNALLQRPEWTNAVMIYDDPTQNPKCQDAAVTTEMETPVAIVIGAYDPYNVPFTFSIVDQPTDGSVTIEMANVDFGAGTLSNPVFSYTPNAGFAGVDTFTYTATNDNGIIGNTATITITIPSQIPSASSSSVSTGMNLPVEVSLSATDPNNLPLTYAISDNPVQGVISESAGVYTYTPNNDYIGLDSFTYTASNGTYTSPNATVSITINSRTPIANDYDVTTSINLPVELSFNATDPYNLPLTYTIETNPSNGSVAESNGVWTYTPEQDYSGVVSFTYTASNGTFTSSSANVNITID